MFISGGQLGLWVGISAISVCELFDLIAQLVVYLCAPGAGKVDPKDSTKQAGLRDKKLQQQKGGTHHVMGLPKVN